MKEDKAAFVEALGAALAYSRTGIIDLDYNKDPDGFENDEKTVNVTYDSCLAIMHDIYKELI